MDYEKKYNEALEKARQLCAYPTTKPFISDLQDLFPELVEESEDERIRKEMIEILKKEAHDFPSSVIANKSNSWIAWLEKKAEQNPAWSEEDEKQARQIERIVHNDGCTQKLQKQIADWLKSLRERVQPKQEWSEEDKKLINDTCHLINTLASGYGKKVTEPITFSGTQMIASIKDRLSALADNRLQNTWKPSEEQITVINDTIRFIEDKSDSLNSDYLYNKMKELLEQLKAL